MYLARLVTFRHVLQRLQTTVSVTRVTKGKEKMKPYYQDKWVTIYHGDCREILPELPKVDLVLTDPPYGLGIAKSGSLSIKGASAKRLEYAPSNWDIKPQKDTFDLMLSHSQEQIIWGGNYFTDYLYPSQCWLIWYKKDGLPAKTFADCELAWTSFQRPAKVFNSRWHGFIRDSKEKKLGVATQKALDLFVWCLESFAEETDLVLDPFLGSGTTAEACQKLNRHCIGIEIEEKYCEIAANRCSQSVMRLEV